MSLKQELDTIHAATTQLLADCNAVIDAYLNPVEVLAELPSRIEDVHGVGYTMGNDAGFEIGQQVGYDNGKAAAQDAFWDRIQQNGNRNNYMFFFSGQAWDDVTFKPKYDITCNYAERMFQNTAVTNLKAILEQQGVKLDLTTASKNRNLTMLFASDNLTHLPVIDTSAAPSSSITYLFYGARSVVSIEKWIISNTVEQIYHETNTFQNCDSLVDIVVEGTIWRSLSFQWSPLSRASIESIMAALSDTATGQTVTFNKAAVEAAFTDAEWAALVATKSNWSIAKA